MPTSNVFASCKVQNSFKETESCLEKSLKVSKFFNFNWSSFMLIEVAGGTLKIFLNIVLGAGTYPKFNIPLMLFHKLFFEMN